MLQQRSRSYVTLTKFPDGDVKISGCHRPIPSGNPRPVPKLTEIEIQFKAAARASSMVRDLAKWCQLSYLLTITYRGVVADRYKVQKDWKEFCRRVRRFLPDFYGVAVLEFHKGGLKNDGGIHIHVALDKFMPVNVLRAAWWSVVGEGQGNVDIQHRTFRDSPKKIGAYLAKYVAKDFDSSPRVFGQHRYFRSRAIKIFREKMVFFKGRFREHRDQCRIYLIFESKCSHVYEWLSDDGLQFSFKSYG
jgi:hypothetical protein